jgi:multiple sugar transport system permease protein
MKKSKTTLIVMWVVLVILMMFIILPLYWMLVTAFKSNADAISIPPQLFPIHLTIANFVSQLTDRTGFLTYFMNSLLVSASTTLLTILVSLLAGYAFSRFNFRAKRLLFILILVTQMFPATLMIVGIYTAFLQVGLLNTYLGLTLAFTAFSLPFAIWMMEGFFNTVPKSLEEAAMVDGSHLMNTLWKIILPITAPGIVAVGVYAFLNAWNNLLFALTLASTQNMRTIPPGFLLTYVGEFQYYWSDAMAGSVIVIIPMVIVFIALQRYMVQGMAAGAVKQ